MKNFGRSSVHAFLGDRVVYRNLVPFDRALPDLEQLRHSADLPAPTIPRKSEPAYARVVAHMLAAARAVDLPAFHLQRLIFVGDTRLNDATAFDNLCQAGGWSGVAFIASETADPSACEVVATRAGFPLYLANRWSALGDFDRFCQERDFPVDEATVVVVDLDKTAIGARGRNAQVIDQARVQAVYQTVAGLLGDSFDQPAFQAAYTQLNQVAFHPFTADNQDYLAYICLILGSDLFSLAEVVDQVQRGELRSFVQFIDQVNERATHLPPALGSIHRDIYHRVQAGDPTPFKSFRRQEYLETIRRMGYMADTAPVTRLLAEEIVITQEVFSLALEWARRGALLFGLSDKPDEASLPTPGQSARGLQPIHRTQTHLVGSG